MASEPSSEPQPAFNARDQLAIAVTFLTRLPLPQRAAPPDDAVARAAWAFPLVGAGIGLIAGCVAALALACKLPPSFAAIAGLGAGIWLTGALHEDGLADSADGLGGGASAARRLEIMKDSRIGSYGALALVLGMLAKYACLERLGLHGGLVAVFIAAHALGRSGLPYLMYRLPMARPGGVAAGVGRPSLQAALTAAALGWLIAILCLGFGRGTLAMVAAAIVASLQGALARRKIGGYTGDILGAAEQLAEIAVLLVAAAGM